MPDVFDKYAFEYNECLKRGLKFWKRDIEIFSEYKIQYLRENISQLKGKIMDFGCGIGNNINRLQSAYPNCEIIGVDSSYLSLSVAEKKYENATFKHLDDMHALNSFRGSISMIFASNVFHHIPIEHIKDWLLKLSFCLSNKGYLVIFEHNPYNIVTKYIVSKHQLDKDANLVRMNMMTKYLNETGYKLIEKKYVLICPLRNRLVRWFEIKLSNIPMGLQYFVIAQKKK